MAMFSNLSVEFRDALSRCGDFGAELFDVQAHDVAFATDDDSKTLAAMALDDIEERLVQAAFSQQVHRHSGREWKFVFHAFRLKSPATF